LAYKALGQPEIRAEVISCDRKTALLYSLIENIARVPPGTMWFAAEVKRMYDSGLSVTKIAQIVCKSPTYVHDYIQLVEQGEQRLIRGVAVPALCIPGPICQPWVTRSPGSSGLWRRGRDSNPRCPCEAHGISSAAPSATRSPLRLPLSKNLSQTPPSGATLVVFLAPACSSVVFLSFHVKRHPRCPASACQCTPSSDTPKPMPPERSVRPSGVAVQVPK
jgi:hypothetical protein